ncbi:hypothetical protein [Polyangium sorediatum]|uniref:Uncharacterized protein n=1 Tax=Polyangium sorediatum TaxID=889274 RepID=A0ABT6P5A0_9BACT|nr:hypothetical protein [Polyangium sorediatum]MDI1435806.1 hypothetical protein [Polyangium sorediatum]
MVASPSVNTMLDSRALLLVSTGLLLASCHAPDRQADAHVTDSAATTRAVTPPALTSSRGVEPDAGVPPAVERACQRDDECAVARVEVSGGSACCPACGTTPGTRRWHADLQRYCAAHPPSTCPPLACPEGPTRAVCRDGLCQATATGPDGQPTRIPVEQQCLPAMVCDAWAGCALVNGNTQDGWFIAEGEQVPRGEIAMVKNVCTVGNRCDAAIVLPPGVVCAPWSVPPRIEAPRYTCALEGGKCLSRPAPPPPGPRVP